MKKRIFCLLIALSVVFTMGTINTNAADNAGSGCKLKISSGTVYIGGKLKNKLQGAAGKVIWKSSNKKVATVSGKGVIKGIKPGKCTVSAKYKGKTYKCRIRVKRREPDFDAEIVDVRWNKKATTIVKVRFRNKGSKTLTVMQKAEYNDFTKPTYKVKLSSAKGEKIKAHKSKTVTFINYGKYDIYNHAGRTDPDIFALLEATLSYEFKYDGKKYPGITYWYEETDEETNDTGYYYDSLYYSRGNSLDTLSKNR